MEIHTYDTAEENTGKLIITLPKKPDARAKLFEWSAQRAEDLGFDPETDDGQEYLFVMLD